VKSPVQAKQSLLVSHKSWQQSDFESVILHQYIWHSSVLFVNWNIGKIAGFFWHKQKWRSLWKEVMNLASCNIFHDCNRLSGYNLVFLPILDLKLLDFQLKHHCGCALTAASTKLAKNQVITCEASTMHLLQIFLFWT